MAKRKPPGTGKRSTAREVRATEDKPAPAVPDAPPPRPENDDAEPCGPDGLNVRRRLFVEYLTGEAFGNATRAAELAGYASENRLSLKSTATRLLSFVNVQKAIARRLAKSRMTADAIREGIAELAGSNMANFLRVGPDGQPRLDWEAAAAAGAIGELREWYEEGADAGDGAGPLIIKRKFKLYDRLRALELQAKVHGLLNADPPEPERKVYRRPMTVGGGGSDGGDGPCSN